MATDRTSLTLPDERKRLFEQASEIVASDDHDDPPRSDVIDAALTHLIESHENLNDVRDKYPPGTVKDCCNTSVVGLRYRTSIEGRWR
jgi:metal-responsive CopG/Arc/MetJ family transcriptional regulator